MRLCSNMRVIAMIVAILSCLCKNSRIRIVRMTDPTAGIDVDKPADVELVERILATREADDSNRR